MSEIENKGQVRCQPDNIKKVVRHFAVISVILAGLVVISHYNFSLFHSVAELSAILIMFTVSIIAYNTYDLCINEKLTAMGISFGFISVLNLLHLLTYKGMGVFTRNTGNVGIYFSISSMYMESLSLLLLPLIALKIKRKHIKPSTVAYFYLIIVILIIVISFFLSTFHIYFINEYKINLFSKINGIVITIIFLLTIIAFLHSRKFHNPNIFKCMMTYLVIRAISQLILTACSNIYDVYDVLGHTLGLISYYFFYKALIQSSLRKPIETIFAKLNSMNLELEKKTSQLMKLNQELLQEIAERKETERMLQQSRLRYRQLIDILPDGIFLFSKGIITFTNKAGLLLLGASDFHVVIGKPALQFVHPDFQESIIKSFKGVEEKSSTVYLQKMKLIKMDGTIVDIEATGTSLVEDNDISIIGIAKDISGQVKAEELTQSILEKDSLLDKAVEIDRMKTEFIANISHELRTPINVITSTIQLASQFYNNAGSSSSTGKLGKYFNIMNQNCRRLLKLVNNLIDATKIDAGFVEPRMKNCNIVEIVEDITLSVAEFIESKGISLIFDTAIEEMITACDPDIIERIILNLLSNATKFTKPEGIIKVDISDTENSVIISVTDTGIGVPDDMKEAIFERFRQVDQSLTRTCEGSGIGLSLVKSLVEMHGGTITLKSKYGYGSKFIIELPVRLLESSESYIDKKDFTVEQSRIERIKVEFSDIYESA